MKVRYDLEPEAPQEQWHQWAELVHEEWLRYNNDAPRPDEMEAQDALNRLKAWIERDEGGYLLDAFHYLLRMESAAHAAAHVIEARLMGKVDA